MIEPDKNEAAEILGEAAEQEETIEPVEVTGLSDAEFDGAEIEDVEPEKDKPEESTPEKTGRSRVWERWILFLIAGSVIFFDQYTKRLVEEALELFTYWAPWPEFENWFRITHISNTGVAFGLFQNGNIIFTVLAIIVAIAIIIYNARLEGGHKLLRLALGLQMGGAIGNMIDRLRLGHVTDFMDFGPWPVWNIADLAIVSGTILLVLVMFEEERQEKKAAQEINESNVQNEPALDTTGTSVDEIPTS